MFLIAYNFKAVIATDLKPGITILRSLHYTRCKLLALPTSGLGVAITVSHTVKNQLFYASRWSPTVSGRKVATLSNILDFFSRRAGVKPEA